MRRLIIEIPEAGDLQKTFDVVDEAGRRCNGLCFGEMLEQISMLTVNAIPAHRIGSGYEMRTPDEWQERLSIINGGRAE